MKLKTFHFKWLITLFIACHSSHLIAKQDHIPGTISGHIALDKTWERTIFLSYIKTFDDMYLISPDMIISKAAIDSFGYFKFDIRFIPEEESLFRLHLTKKGNSPASLIIGGNDENHMFLIANNRSVITLNANSPYPPFKNVTFNKSKHNTEFQKVTSLVYLMKDSASRASSITRQFIEHNLNKALLSIADTSSTPLVSLYAVYNSNFELNYHLNENFYKSYLSKWKSRKDSYFKSFKEKLNLPNTSNYAVIFTLGSSCFLLIGFFIGKSSKKKRNKIEKLSIQERKIFELLKHGATNQEISDAHNIGISTVKTHVSNIYAKLNVKSRRDIMNIE